MKKNKRAAHAPHCYWHKNLFKLQERAPYDEPIAEWEGTPQMTTSTPAHMADYKERDRQLKAAAIGRLRKKRKLVKAKTLKGSETVTADRMVLADDLLSLQDSERLDR